MKKVMVHFEFPKVSLNDYDNVWEELKKQGFEHPNGLVYHVGASTPAGDLVVVDVWESEEKFKEFGKTLMPIISKFGLPNIHPRILPVHYIHEGQAVLH